MTDDNDHPGPSPDVPTPEVVLGQLIDRHNDLVQAWEDNDDPDIRSEISFEIQRLDAQINELTELQPFEEVRDADGPTAEQPVDRLIEAVPDHQSDSAYGDDTGPVPEPGPADGADYFGDPSPTGDPYPTGDTGQIGDPHPTGDPYPTGDTGQIGDPHPTGDTGQIGDPHPTGDPYPTGDSGQLGHTVSFGDASPIGDAIAAHNRDDDYRTNGMADNELNFSDPSTTAASDFGAGSEAQHAPYARSDYYVPPPEWPAPVEATTAAEAEEVGPDPSPPASGRYAFNPQPTARIPNPDQTADSRDSQGPTARSGFAGLGGGQFTRPSGPVLAVVGVSLALLAGVLWFGRSDEPNETRADAQTTVVADPAAPGAESPADAVVSNVRAVLDGLGLSGVVVDERNGTIHIGGPVPSQTDYDAGVAAARAVAGDFPIDISALVIYGEEAAAAGAAAPTAAGRSEALQMELDRLLAANPLIFGSGQAALTELHQRILNNAVLVLTGYPGLEVTIAGFTDEQGDDASNQGLSLSRAENVKAYLVAQGIPADSLQVKAIGEQATSGSDALARLERRVEFEVTGAGSEAAPRGSFRVGIVAPSASNDLAFTQSMVDAVNVLATEMNIEIAVTDNTFVPDEAAAAVRLYAEQDFDLVIAHGSQFGAALIEIAPQFPETAFAWGTASDTFGLPNVYAYDAAAQEGGYVLGALATTLSTSKVTGVVGPIEVGDAAQYITGFEAGARAEDPATNVLVSYTGSFSDITLAAETAQAHIGGGADVLTGSAQMVVGAISTVEQQGALWFGTQANQASLAPGNVVASQVYHWEVALRPILSDISAGTLAGTTYTANLANGGLIIEYNPDYPLSPEARQRADELTAAIASGDITPPG